MLLFLAPFLTFAAGRLSLGAAVPPAALVAGTAALVVLLGGLLWLHHADSLNAGHAYVPAQWRDGRIIPGHAAP